MKQDKKPKVERRLFNLLSHLNPIKKSNLLNNTQTILSSSLNNNHTNLQKEDKIELLIQNNKELDLNNKEILEDITVISNKENNNNKENNKLLNNKFTNDINNINTNQLINNFYDKDKVISFVKKLDNNTLQQQNKNNKKNEYTFNPIELLLGESLDEMSFSQTKQTGAKPQQQEITKKLDYYNNRDNTNYSKEYSKLIQESTKSRTQGSDVLLQFSPIVTGQIKQSQVTYISPHAAYTVETLQAGVLLVAHTRADIRRKFINRLCDAAVERSSLIYSIAPQGGVNVATPGVYKLSTHPTLSRRAILNALLRHGAHLLIFGIISTRDDVMSLMDAAYTGYHCVAEIFGESAHDVLSRLEAIGVDVTMLPQNLRIIVPAG
ncbi:hypothetical protein ABK040_015518 [Willaertia magna]